MEHVLLLSTALVLLSGLVLMLVALRHRKPDAPPFASLNPRHWTAYWGSDHYTAPGRRLNITGWILCTAGLIMFVVKLTAYGMG